MAQSDNNTPTSAMHRRAFLKAATGTTFAVGAAHAQSHADTSGSAENNFLGDWVATDRDGRNLGSLTIGPDFNSMRANNWTGSFTSSGGGPLSADAIRAGEQLIFKDEQGQNIDVKMGGEGNWLSVEFPDGKRTTFRRRGVAVQDPSLFTDEQRRVSAYYDSYEDHYFDYTDTYWDQGYFDYYDGTSVQGQLIIEPRTLEESGGDHNIKAPDIDRSNSIRILGGGDGQ